MISPFRKHQLSTRAYLAAAAAGAVAMAGAAPEMPEEGPEATEYQLLRAKLHDDLRRLHGIQSRDAKIALKAELITAYLPWVEGALAVDEDAAAPQDEIVVTVFIWAADTRQWPLAIELCAHIVQHNLSLPERFNRKPGGLLISEMSDVAINEPGAVSRDALLSVSIGEGPGWDMKDETRARYHRAIGEAWARDAENFDPTAESAPAGGKAMMVDAALTSLREAIRLHANVGVKKLVEQLEREAKKLAEAAGATSEQ